MGSATWTVGVSVGEGVAYESDWVHAAKLMASTTNMKGAKETVRMIHIIAEWGGAVALFDNGKGGPGKGSSLNIHLRFSAPAGNAPMNAPEDADAKAAAMYIA